MSHDPQDQMVASLKHLGCPMFGFTLSLISQIQQLLASLQFESFFLMPYVRGSWIEAQKVILQFFFCHTKLLCLFSLNLFVPKSLFSFLDIIFFHCDSFIQGKERRYQKHQHRRGNMIHITLYLSGQSCLHICFSKHNFQLLLLVLC